MKQDPRNRNAFTLVEILIVIVIAAVVIAIAIPRIRTINKERNIREAARVVGSAFANASQRGVTDGIAGVRITRNPNFAQGSLQFATTQLSLLRAVPNYTGDTEDATVSAVTGNTVSIPRPIEQDELQLVKIGDSISFGGSSIKYRISDVGGFLNLDLTLERGSGNYMPMPAMGTTFVIHRLPRPLRSSTSVLPDNYIVDLRFSGFETLDGFGTTGSFVPPYTGAPNILDRQLTTIFEPAPTDLSGGVFPAVENYIIDVIFDEEGAVDGVFYRDGIEVDANVVSRVPLGPLYFLVTEAPDSYELGEEVATADEQALWVTISNNSGATNVGYNNANETAGLRYSNLTAFYFAAVDPDLDEEMDRDEFNGRIRRARDNSVTTSAIQ
jgi:prepilin-type N-terminal cleavage/methylation domain-containing protein